MPSSKLNTSDDLLICCGCGAQYDVPESTNKTNCRVCDDPRQYIPPPGQRFTTLSKLRSEGHKNVFQSVPQDSKVTEIYTEPKFGIGQSARLISTPHGNVMWDCVAYLDEATVKEIEGRGGLKAIVISHPHFYTTWAEWSATFNCPVYTAAPDAEWLNRKDQQGANLQILNDIETEIVPGIKAVICGGHFPGSMVLHSLPPNTDLPSLFVADTIFATAASHNPPEHYFPGVTPAYAFLYAIPNYTPLAPDEILRIWRRLKGREFKATYGVMAKLTNVFENPDDKVSLRSKVLDGAKISVRSMGWREHDIFQEKDE